MSQKLFLVLGLHRRSVNCVFINLSIKMKQFYKNKTINFNETKSKVFPIKADIPSTTNDVNNSRETNVKYCNTVMHDLS